MDYLAIGKIKKPHGLNGELKADLEERFFEAINQAEAFFVELQGEQTPYFIESIRGKDPFMLKLEEVDSKEDAALFTNKTLYLRREDVPLSDEELDEDDLEFGFLKGYQLHDQELGLIGEILDVQEFPQQEMATVAYQGKEVLVPLTKLWITNIQENEKIVQMDLPEGLLEV